jgi:hypothetical protein
LRRYREKVNRALCHDRSESQPKRHRRSSEAGGRYSREIKRKAAVSDGRADHQFAEHVGRDAAKIATTALCSDKVCGGSLAIETLMASTSASPMATAPRIVPIAPIRSLTRRPATTIIPRKMANPTTDQKANGLRIRGWSLLHPGAALKGQQV